MAELLSAKFLSQFSCLGDRCPDTCCRNWSMQMDEATLTRYRNEAPELLDAVEPGEAGAPWIMRKDTQSGYCVKLEDGLCGIHKQHGDKFLGDACHFYPRVTRSLGTNTLMTATGSCPEVVRLMLEDEMAFDLENAHADRLPHSLKDYLPEGLGDKDALIVHQAFLNAAKDPAPAEIIFARIMSASRSLEMVDKKNWADAAAFFLQSADARLPAAESDAADPFNLLHALAGLMVATHKRIGERLQKTVADMEAALHVTLDWQNVLIHTDEKSLGAYEKLHAAWKENGEAYQPALRRWLAMQMSVSLYPFSGLGANSFERSVFIGVRLATLRLALMCAHEVAGGILSKEEVIRVIQSLSRFLDHLGDPLFSLQIYTETGWIREARLRGLIS